MSECKGCNKQVKLEGGPLSGSFTPAPYRSLLLEQDRKDKKILHVYTFDTMQNHIVIYKYLYSVTKNE